MPSTSRRATRRKSGRSSADLESRSTYEGGPGAAFFHARARSRHSVTTGDCRAPSHPTRSTIFTQPSPFRAARDRALATSASNQAFTECPSRFVTSLSRFVTPTKGAAPPRPSNLFRRGFETWIRKFESLTQASEFEWPYAVSRARSAASSGSNDHTLHARPSQASGIRPQTGQMARRLRVVPANDVDVLLNTKHHRRPRASAH